MSLAIDWLRPRRAEDPMRYLDDVFRYAHARLGQREDAEDVAIEVVQALPNPCRRRDLRLYMIGMARRKVADRMRRRTKEMSAYDEPAVTFDTAVDRATMVAETLRRISEEHRELLLMKYVLGLTSAEIAELFGSRQSAVDSSLQKARDAFSKHWVGREDEVLK